MNLLKIYRMLAGLTQTELARVTEIEQGTLSKIEKGRVEANAEQKKKLVEALNQWRPRIILW